MSTFPSIDKIRDFITHNTKSWDRDELFKPLPFVLIREFLCSDMSYSAWYKEFVVANPDSFTLPGQTHSHNYTHYLYKSQSDKAFFDAFVLNDSSTDGLQQLAVAFPEDLRYTIADDVFDGVDLERMGPKGFLTVVKQKLNTIHWPSDWIIQNFHVDIPVDIYDKFSSHEIVMFCSSNLFVNPHNKYWVMTLPLDSPHVMTHRKISLRILTKTTIVFVSAALQSSVFFGNKRIGVLHGYPVCFFLLDKKFDTKVEYLWGGVRVPLEYIIADLQNHLNLFKESDHHGVVARLGQLASAVAKKANADYVEANLSALDYRVGTIEAAREGLDLDRILLDFHGRIEGLSKEMRQELDEFKCNGTGRVIKETLQNANTSWWADIVGGVGGGLLGGLGSVLGGLIGAKGAAAGGLAKSVGGNAIDAVNGVLKGAGTTLEGIGDLISGLANTVNELKESVTNNTPDFDSSHLEARIRKNEVDVAVLKRDVRELRERLRCPADPDQTDRKEPVVPDDDDETVPKECPEPEPCPKCSPCPSPKSTPVCSPKSSPEASLEPDPEPSSEPSPEHGGAHGSGPGLVGDPKDSDRESGIGTSYGVDESLEWLKSDRIRRILKPGGLFDRLKDSCDELHVTNMYLNARIDNMQGVKQGLVASYTTGSHPFNPSSNVRFQDERKTSSF